MIFKTDRPNLQVYVKGSFEPVQFVGKRYETDDEKEIKVLQTIEGVSEVQDVVEKPEEKSGFFSKKKREEIMRNDESVLNEKVSDDE